MKLTEKNKSNFWEKVIVSDIKFCEGTPCWEWQGATKMKAGAIGINGKVYNAHRISWIIHNGNIPKKLFVLHKCDNRPCVNPNHLFLGTQKDNVIDMVNKGRRGERLNPRKLDELEVSEIREIANIGELSYPQIGKMFNVSGSHVCNIVNYKTWKSE